jgi:CDP-glucose 4,6-dehydratase
VETMVIDRAFWSGRRVFLTGHTGFKGAWTCLALTNVGARVVGYALPPATLDGIYCTCDVPAQLVEHLADIRDISAVRAAIRQAKPSIVLHMAAQALVRRSYADPIETYSTNVMGTANLLEAIRGIPEVQAVVIVTSDKCYENFEWPWGYRESDRLGGHDPYSSSKACAELVTDAFRRSYFSQGSTGIASARAGNVIGGGDWSTDRLLPDAIRAFMTDTSLTVRNPLSVRPWQHVLDPVIGYLLLAQALCGPEGPRYCEGWNFGPDSRSEVSVHSVVTSVARVWGGRARWEQNLTTHPHEAIALRLDSAKTRHRLGWKPLIDLDEAIQWTVEWYKAFHDGGDVRAVAATQVDAALSRAAQIQKSL